MPEDNQQERTEPATPRRREEARKKGNVPKSLELNSVVLLFVAPVGTMCIVLATTISGYFLAGLFIFGDPLPKVDSLMWHGVVLVGGGLLGVFYCRAVAGWLVHRTASVNTPKTASKLEGV